MKKDLFIFTVKVLIAALIFSLAFYRVCPKYVFKQNESRRFEGNLRGEIDIEYNPVIRYNRVTGEWEKIQDSE